MSASSQVTRTERLLNLVIALLAARSPVSRQAVQLSVVGYDPSASTAAFERMFERDKDELRSMGIPIETIADAHGEVLGYLIDTAEYATRDVSFDADELMALNLAALVWDDAILRATATTAVRKLESTGAVPTAVSEPAAIPSFAHVSASDAALLPLMRSVRDQKVVRFSYRKPEGTESSRRVDPWTLHANDGRWYLSGWDHERGSARTFRVSRIEGSVTVTAESSTTERPAAPAVDAEDSEDDLEIGFVLPARQGAELRRHPTFRPAPPDLSSSGSDMGTVCTIRDSSRRALSLLWRAGPDVYPVFPQDVVSAFRRGLEELEADHS